MDLTTFNNNFTVKVTRYETYPAEEPKCYVVGFQVTYIHTLKNMYIDCQVPLYNPSLTEDYDSDDIIKLAWDSLYENIKEWAIKTMGVNPIINSIHVPTSI